VKPQSKIKKIVIATIIMYRLIYSLLLRLNWSVYQAPSQYSEKILQAMLTRKINILKRK